MKNKTLALNQNNSLLELQLLKSKIYKKSNYFKTAQKKIQNDKIKIFLKKFSHIIYEYHINNKKILFVNFPNILTLKMHFILKNYPKN